MRLLIIAAIFAVVVLLLYLRLRPYIRMARQVFGVARGVQGAMRQDSDGSSARGAANSGDRLVRCDSCGTWIPSSRALKLRSSNASYCSQKCLATSAQESERKAAS